MRLDPTLPRWKPPAYQVCSDCFRLVDRARVEAVWLSSSYLEEKGIKSLPPGLHVFCTGEELAACERTVAMMSMVFWQNGLLTAGQAEEKLRFLLGHFTEEELVEALRRMQSANPAIAVDEEGARENPSPKG